MKPRQSGILSRAVNFAARMRRRPSLKKIEEQIQWQRSAEAERETRVRRHTVLGPLQEQSLETHLRELVGLFSKDGILRYNRVQLARNPEMLKTFEAKLLFMFALNEGFITEAGKVNGEFSRWLKGIDVDDYCRLMQERFPGIQPPSPEIIRALQRDTQGTYRRLRLGKADEHKANILIGSIIRIQQGQEE